MAVSGNPRVRAGLACVLAAGALLAGCSNTISGDPRANRAEPTEPTVPTPRPTRTTPTSSVPPSTPPPPTAAPPAGAEVLPAENGYVFIVTKSGLTQCQLSTESVGCQSEFENPPQVNGEPANGVSITADGSVSWIVGNLGAAPFVTIDYRTYAAVGWTIAATEQGTRFTNDGTGHGMFVSIQKVDTF